MIGQVISHYAIEGALGEGGMGTVYLARDTKLGRKVAIKVLSSVATGDPAVAGRLLREAQAASRLNHPSIVTVHEIARADDRDFIVMEHVEGETLARLIPPGGLPIARVLDLAVQITGAVAAAHAAGIIHRDLKAANVIVTPSSRAKVLDFGLAKIGMPRDEPTHATRLTTTGLIMGTVGYMSPEQIEGRPGDARSDVFSLGVLFFEMLTGHRPFAGDSDWAVMASTVHGEAPQVTAVRPETPPQLARIVAQCLARRPDDRYVSAVELAVDLARLGAAPRGAPDARTRRLRVLAIASTVLGILAAVAVVWSLMRESRSRWAREVAIVEIDRLTAADDHVGAYQIARRALEIAPDDSRIQQAWRNLTLTATISSEPPGADVAIGNYLGQHDRWVSIGTTPVPDANIPLGLLRWRLTKPGHDTLEVGQSPNALEFRLVPSASSRPGMVFVPRGSFPLQSTSEEVPIPEFWLDRYEVTNREFKAFVDAGGYRRREYWKQPVMKGGRALTWEAAMAEFRDVTGRPGPSTWELGTYPEGQGDHPVGGVSWYEAAAYAAFAGKQLPTAYHWSRASGAFGIFSEIIRASNFAGKGTVPMGSLGGIGPFGTYDMAGNVKEWCWSSAGGGRRYILGGGWDETDYMFHDQDAQSPLERRATFGFRCMIQQEPMPARLAAEIETLERDPASWKPVAEDVYRAFLRLYDYDPAPLEPAVESVDDGNPAWRMERVTIRAAYADERLPLCLYIPKSAAPPFQAVVLFPGSGALRSRSSQSLRLRHADFLVRSGRMLVYPIYKGTYERRSGPARGPNEIRDLMIQRGKDIRRTLDYLESRPDVDRSRVAFYGISWSAQLGPLMLAIEPRFRTGVFFAGGFETSWGETGGGLPPEADPVNFTPHVRDPVLMVNGRQDFDLPYASAQVPMFRLLGTPAADKRHAVFEGGHLPPRLEEAIRVMLDWLDDRLGPVR